MFCKNCGAEIADGAQFCTSCGAAVVKEEPVVEATPVQAAPVQAAPVVAAGNPTKALVFGIISLVADGTMWGAIVGLIFGILGKKEAKKCAQPLTGKAKVGAILSKIGFILSFVSLVILAIYIVVLIVAAITSAASNAMGYYY